MAPGRKPIITGSGAKLIKDDCDFVDNYVPNLVIKGIAPGLQEIYRIEGVNNSPMSVFAAVMTGKGTGAIATIQLYGDSAADILKQIFLLNPKNLWNSRQAKFCWLLSQSGDKTIDQVTIGCEGNNTYAINCHGNPLIVEEIMQLLRQ